VKSFRQFFLYLPIVVILTACSAMVPEPTTMAATDTATVTPSPSVTIVWFPPTDTPTPVPTRIIEPTAQMRPAVGQIIVADAFVDSTNWITGSYKAGNIASVDQSLTLAIQEPKAFLQSFLSQPAVDQFDLQVNVNVSLCRGEDSYGLLIRAASEWDYYRFLVNCQGYARAERIRNSQTTLMQDWTWAGVIPGAPVANSLEVWAVDKEMRFFVNDNYVFSVSDPVFSSGQVGLFARSGGENAMTVNFSDMVIRSINRSELIEAVTATP
jgi:hypothetical protein